jgi:hypothetical protein
MTNLSQQTGTLSRPQTSGAEDWEAFRHFVRIIQIVGELIIKYEDLEVVIEKKIQEIFLHSIQKSPFGSNNLLNSQLNDMQSSLLSMYNFKEYLLQDSDRIKLNRLISIVESGLILKYDALKIYLPVSKYDNILCLNLILVFGIF